LDRFDRFPKRPDAMEYASAPRVDRVQARVATLESSLQVYADATIEHTLSLDALQARLTQLEQGQQHLQAQVSQIAHTQQQIQQQLTQVQNAQQTTKNQLKNLRQCVARGRSPSRAARSPRGRSRSRGAIEDAASSRVAIGSATRPIGSAAAARRGPSAAR